MRLQYSLSTWNYEAYTSFETLDDAIGDARRSGYGIEVWPSWKGEQNLFAPENRERLVRLIRDIPSSLHGGSITTLEEHKVQIDAAGDTGSSVIVAHAPSLGGENTIDFGFAREVVAYAKERNVTIALENDLRLAGQLEGLAEAVEAVEGLGVCIDIGHLYLAHDRPLKDYMDRLGGRLVHLHLQDVYFVPGTKRAKGDSHRTPGQCDIPLSDWQLLFSTLKKHNYNGLAVFEVRPFAPDEIGGQAVEFLESVVA